MVINKKERWLNIREKKEKLKRRNGDKQEGKMAKYKGKESKSRMNKRKCGSANLQLVQSRRLINLSQRCIL